MTLQTQEEAEGSWQVCQSFDRTLLALIWGANSTGCALQRGIEAVGK